jgi:arylsulfatase A-like enzyme
LSEARGITRWGARAAVAAGLSTAVEMGFLLATVPMVTSSALGLLALVHLLFAIYATVALVWAVLAWMLERRGVAVDLPDLATVLAALLVVAAPAAAAEVLYAKAEAYPEFPERIELILHGAMVVVTAVTLLLARYGVYVGVARLLEKRPAWDRPHATWTILCILAVGAAFALVYLGLGPVYLDRLAAAAAVVAAGCALGAVALLDGEATTAQARYATFAILGAVALSPLSCGQRHASFTLYNHSLAGGPLASLATELVDFDGDGAAPTWLGGADCAALDRRRGPEVHEVAGDGVDQDCRGGDAPNSTDTPKSTLDWSCATPRSSILLVTLDAVRADAISDELTPELARFAGQSLVYTRAYAGSTSTVESLSTLFAGRSLSDLYTDTGSFGLPKSLLATRLDAVGYRAIAVDALDLPDELRRGFADISPWWRDIAPGSGKEHFESAATTGGTLTQLAKHRAETTFVWAHFFDAHAPYLELDYRRGDASRYEREVAYVDLQLGRLFRGLAQLGIADTTAVIVTADHGEELAARGQEGHGPLLYESSIRVPLIARIPGCPPSRIDDPVSSIQLAHAMMGIAGVRLAPPLSRFGDAPFAVTEARSATASGRAIVGKRYKLIVDVHHGGRVLFDLENDPHEQIDIYASDPEAAGELEAMYQAWLDR